MTPRPVFPVSEACTDVAGVPVTTLAAEHGSPLLVFSEAALRRSYRAADRAFRARHPDVRFAWSYKTNYLRAVCDVFHEEGAAAEVVSDFEYEKARASGVPGRDIVFNGPHKPAALLRRAVADGALIQIDHFDELTALTAIAGEHGRPVEVAIRVSADTGDEGWSKFGFHRNGEAARAMARIHATPHLRLVGLHTHVGTSVTDPTAYTRATELLLDLTDLARREFSADMKYLNLGGGFAPQGGARVCPTPSFDAYAEAITRPIRAGWPADRVLPRLYLETGRALVDDAGYLITTVVGRKHGGAACVVDAGVHLLPPLALSRYDIRPARPGATPRTPRTVYGCLCLPTDVLGRDVALPEVAVGDHLVLHPVGAYTLTQSMQFIGYRPRVVMVLEDGRVEVVREREDLHHVERLERSPGRPGTLPPGVW